MNVLFVDLVLNLMGRLEDYFFIIRIGECRILLNARLMVIISF